MAPEPGGEAPSVLDRLSVLFHCRSYLTIPTPFAKLYSPIAIGSPIGHMYWPDLEPPAHHRKVLVGLCAKVTRIGHSSSLVQMWLPEPEEIGEPNWVPVDARAMVHLHVPGPGTLDHLEQQYNAAAVEEYGNLKVMELQADEPKLKKSARKRLREAYGNQRLSQQRPRLSLYQAYAPPARKGSTASVANIVFSPHFLVLQRRAKQGPYQQLDLVSTLTVTNRWRDSILSHCNGLSESVRRMLSGHDSKGGPSNHPHLASLPLALVGHDHADGHLLSMGLALPADLSRDERREALLAIAAVRELKLGPLGVWSVEPVTASQSPWNLRAEAWTAHPKGATHWSTVTPIVFDRRPKAKDKAQYQQETASMIAEACTRIGLPAPREVIITQV
jgi:CRISPR-associated protein Csb2